MQNLIGIDVGGSHVTLAQVSAEKREIVNSTYVREHVDSLADAETIFSAWTNAIEKVAVDLDKSKLIIGVAMPGPFDYEKGISLMQQGKFIHLFEINVKEELAKRLAINPNQIYFLNDAAAFMEGEVFGGAVQNIEKVFGLTLGTGLGSTFFNGQFATDEDLWDSPFKGSIAEDFFATRWFVNRFKELTGTEIAGTKELLDQPKEIQDQIFNEYADNFAEFIVEYIIPYQPQVLVIGGNIAKAYPLFEERLHQNLKNQNSDIPVEISGIFEDAAILGSASFALKNYSKL